MKLNSLSKIIAALLFLGCITSCSNIKKARPEEIAVKPNDLPQMTLELTDGSHLETKSLVEDVIIILFQPDCDHCQREATQISKQMEAFSRYNLYFISTATSSELETFARNFGLAGITNVHFASTELQALIDNFGSIPTPSLYIYNEGKLSAKFNGETDLSKILGSL